MINKNGYVLLSNRLSNNELNYGLSSIKNNKVNYFVTKKFIDDIFIPKIEQTKIINDPVYVKFRLSNNNNSTDASTFHGDVYNNTHNKYIPIFTCLCYFDEAQMEIIPGSHLKTNSQNSIDSYNKRIVLNIKRGDILVFYANIHHRGINYNKTQNRRLLQVFEVFPTRELYKTYIDKLVTVKSSDTILIKIIGLLSYEMAKYPFIINFITKIHYMLMYNDLQYKIALMDIPPQSKINKYVTYEPGVYKNIDEITNVENLNVNIICVSDIHIMHCSNYYMYILLFIIICCIVIYRVINKKN